MSSPWRHYCCLWLLLYCLSLCGLGHYCWCPPHGLSVNCHWTLLMHCFLVIDELRMSSWWSFWPQCELAGCLDQRWTACRCSIKDKWTLTWLWSWLEWRYWHYCYCDTCSWSACSQRLNYCVQYSDCYITFDSMWVFRHSDDRTVCYFIYCHSVVWHGKQLLKFCWSEV